MDTIVCFTKHGSCIRFNVTDIPVQRRGGKGIRAMLLYPEDEIVSCMQSYEIDMVLAKKKK
jgi:DNA gyrase/topoisomerase IV subunit A